MSRQESWSGSHGDQTRFQPGTVAPGELDDYARSVGIEADESGPEQEDERDRRLRRRRRILLMGGPPALAVALAGGWLLAVSTLTLAANHAAVNGDYPAAVSRYETVGRINPLLEQWRVHYNIGTAQLLNEQAPQARVSLEEALGLAPAASMVQAQGADGSVIEVKDPTAPECLVRTNLYAAHVALWQQAQAAGDEAAAQAQQEAMERAADQCPVEPPPDASPSPTPTDASPSPTPTDSPSQSPSPSPGPSSSGTPTPSPTPSASASRSSSPTPNPSRSASGRPSPSPSSSQGGTPSPAPSASSGRPSPSPSPSSFQRERLKDRNNDANDSDDRGSGAGGRRW